MINAHIRAISRLANGPATATNAISRLGCLRFSQVTGTGFAQPNINPVPIASIRPGRRMVPTGSMCVAGWRVSLPSIRAVLPPRRKAIHPWATSCTVMANNTGNAHTAMRFMTLRSSIKQLYSIAEEARSGMSYPYLSLAKCTFSQKGGIPLALPHHHRHVTHQIYNGRGFETAIAAVDVHIHPVPPHLPHDFEVGQR